MQKQQVEVRDRLKSVYLAKRAFQIFVRKVSFYFVTDFRPTLFYLGPLPFQPPVFKTFLFPLFISTRTINSHTFTSTQFRQFYYVIIDYCAWFKYMLYL